MGDYDCSPTSPLVQFGRKGRGCMFPRDTSAPSRPTGEQNKNNDGSTNRRTSNLRQATRSAVLGGRCIGIALLMYRSPWLQPPPALCNNRSNNRNGLSLER